MEMFKKALAIDPYYALAYYRLGWAYEHHYQATQREEDAEKAQEVMNKAYSLELSNPFYNNLRDDSRFREIVEREKKLYVEASKKYALN
jgi:hypothetical protein